MNATDSKFSRISAKKARGTRVNLPWGGQRGEWRVKESAQSAELISPIMMTADAPVTVIHGNKKRRERKLTRSSADVSRTTKRTPPELL